MTSPTGKTLYEIYAVMVIDEGQEKANEWFATCLTRDEQVSLLQYAKTLGVK